MTSKYSHLLKNSDYMLLLLGQLVSKLGSSINTIGLTLYVLKFDNPIMSLGLLSLLLLVPWTILGPYAGILADRYPKKTIIIICDILRGFLSIGLFFISNIWAFYFVVLLQTLLDILFAPAIGGYLPFIVKKDDLDKANAMYASSGKLASLTGPAIGGFLIAWTGVSVVFIINGIAFIISGISEMFISITGVAAPKDDAPKTKSTKRDLMEGIAYIKDHKNFLFIILFFAAASMWFGGIPILYSNILIGELKLSDPFYGILSTVMGLGSLLGAMLIPSILKKARHTSVMILGTAVYALMYVLFSFTNVPAMLPILTLCIGISVSLINVVYGIFLQKEIEKEYIGRVFSLDMALSNFTMVLAVLFITLWGSNFNPRHLMLGSSLLLLVVCGVFYLLDHRMNRGAVEG
ncbi:MAG: MFS transporter [Clostridiales bacterium]|nr:MFS transporter [Clostridiales bacterium]